MRVSCRQHSPLEGRSFDLTGKLAFAPLRFHRQPQIELALFRPFVLPHNHEVVRPRQNSHQWYEFWLIGVNLVELFHSPKVRGGESLEIWSLPEEPFGQLPDNPFAPTSLRHSARQVRANSPISVNQRDVDGLIGLGAASSNDAEHLSEFGVLLDQFGAHSAKPSSMVMILAVTPFSSASISSSERGGLKT